MNATLSHIFDDARMESLRDICRRFRVRKLEVFGSATTDGFDPDRSDIDFLYEFEPDDGHDAFDRYFDFAAALEQLFGRKVDLVDASQIRNPYFLRKVDQQRRVIYAA